MFDQKNIVYLFIAKTRDEWSNFSPSFAELLTRINWELSLGCFEMNYADGEIRFRTSMILPGADITDAIAEHGGERAVVAACANDNADFAESALQQVMARFETHERVLAAIAYRSVLPLAVSEKLVTLVGDQLRDHLIAHHAVSPRPSAPRSTPTTRWSSTAEPATWSASRSACCSGS